MTTEPHVHICEGTSVKHRPRRIQRRRTKGWRMPPKSIYAGRGSLFGNPFPVKKYGLEKSLSLFERWADGTLSPDMCPEGHEAMKVFKTRVKGVTPMAWARDKYRDCDFVACWCSLSLPCHVDIQLGTPSEDLIKQYHNWRPNVIKGVVL